MLSHCSDVTPPFSAVKVILEGSRKVPSHSKLLCVGAEATWKAVYESKAGVQMYEHSLCEASDALCVAAAETAMAQTWKLANLSNGSHKHPSHTKNA